MINPAELDLKEETVIRVTRVAKVTSRGKNFRFGALVVVGDGKGHVGRGQGKAGEVMSAINKAKEIYGGVIDAYEEDPGYSQTIEAAKRVYAIISWFEQNYADMSEPQRYVMTNKFLIPMVRNNFRSTMDIADVEEDGKPKMFDELVGRQVEMMGGQPTKMKTYSESVESQIARIDKLLNEADPIYDLRIYNIQVGCTVDNDLGGSESETATEIRGIPGVTTVRPVAEKKRNTS